MPDALPSHDPNIGRVVAEKYRLDAPVGSGGAGTVYRAMHLVLDRVIALKVLNPNLVSNPTAKARFRREARAASKLDHPHSVQVFDYGIEPDGLTYLAMEFLEGRELFKVIYDDWPMGTERVVRVVSQVLSVLAAAHEIGIVHRDLKPENIMLVTRAGDDGKPTEIVKVADFGIAKTFHGAISEESLNLTRDGTVHGTPEYMAPEQARGDEVDGRADLYACGMILYEMLVGALPFTGDNAFDVILKQLTDPVPLPSAKRPDVDRRLEPVIMRALFKDRDKRYPDARAMRAALLEAVATPLPDADASAARVPPDVMARRETVSAATPGGTDADDVAMPLVQYRSAAPTAPDTPERLGRAATVPIETGAPRVARRMVDDAVETLDQGPPPKVPGHSRWHGAMVVVMVLAAVGAIVLGAAWFLAHGTDEPTPMPDAGVAPSRSERDETPVPARDGAVAAPTAPAPTSATTASTATTHPAPERARPRPAPRRVAPRARPAQRTGAHAR